MPKVSAGPPSALHQRWVGKLDEAATLLQQIDVKAVAQLAGGPDWGAGVTLAQAEIAYRRRNFDAA